MSPRGIVVHDPRTRSHVCSHCKKAFLRSEHLQRHILSHEKKRPFTCSACDASYGRVDVLQRHRRRCSQYLHQVVAPTAGSPAPSTDAEHRQSISTEYATRGPSALFPDGPTDDRVPVSGDTEQREHVPTAMESAVPRGSGDAINHADPLFGDGPSSLQPQQSLPSSNVPPAPPVDMYSLQMAGSEPLLQPTEAHLFLRAVNTRLDGSNSASMVPSATHPIPTPMDFSNFPVDEEMFLEDTLLFQFNYNHSGLTIPSTPNPFGPFVSNLPEENNISTQLSPPDSVTDVRPSASTPSPLCITPDELQVFFTKLAESNTHGDLDQFQRPSLSRTLRCLTAYFQHFDPHTPVIHYASFKIYEAHPSLTLIMLAIGALHLYEQRFAQSAYEASCILLAQHEKRAIKSQDSSFHLWHAQTLLLCAQFGVCAGEDHLFLRAQQHLFTTQMAMLRGMNEIRTRSQSQTNNWANWIFVETSSRITSWMFVISAMCLAFDPFAMAIIPPMPYTAISSPCDESVWHAVSEAEWKIARRVDPANVSTDLWTLSKAVFNGDKFDSGTRISAFSLLALIGAFLSSICARQRLSAEIYNPFDSEFVSKTERALATWEGLWRRHPRAEQSMTRLDHPLLNDCLSLLGSAYYHLYLGEELHILKKIAQNPECGLRVSACRDRSRAYKAVKYAANSWLIRAKLGVTYLNKTGGLELGPQALITAYESALILAWWLHIQSGNTFQVEALGLEDKDAAVMLQRQFQDILDELEEQGIHYNESGVLTLRPIDFYISLLEGKIWGSSKVMEERLRGFASHL